MTQMTKKTDDRTDSWNAYSRHKPVTTGEWEGVAYCSGVGISGNIPTVGSCMLTW